MLYISYLLSATPFLLLVKQSRISFYTFDLFELFIGIREVPVVCLFISFQSTQCKVQSTKYKLLLVLKELSTETYGLRVFPLKIILLTIVDWGIN